MKRITSTLFFLFLIFILISCSNELVPDKQVLTYDDFATQLKPDMRYQAIVRIFGEPDQDNGSGIHIFVYVLRDSTEIWIGYTDKVLYAKHMDENQQLIRNLI
jgi:hypothetical protein